MNAMCASKRVFQNPLKSRSNVLKEIAGVA